MKLCYKSLLASLLLCMPLCHIQAAAEIGPDNIYQILSGIEDLQDGIWRSIEKVNHICNDSVLNVELHSLFAELARAGEEGHELLLRIGTEFHIVIPGIIQPPLDDDYSDEEDAGDDLYGEVPGTQCMAPELPKDVLEFLYTNGKIGENYEEGMWIIPELKYLPPELIKIMFDCDPSITRDLVNQLIDQSVILKDRQGLNIISYGIIALSPDSQFIAALTTNGHCHLFNDQGTYINSLKDARGEKITVKLQKSVLPQDLIITIDDEGRCHLHDFKGSHIVSALPHQVRSDRMGITLSPDGELIIIWDTESYCHLYNGQGSYIATLPHPVQPRFCSDGIRISPDGQLIIARDKTNGFYHLYDNQGIPILSKDLNGKNLSWLKAISYPMCG